MKYGKFFSDLLLTDDGWELDEFDGYETGHYCRNCGRAWRSEDDLWHQGQGKCGCPAYFRAKRDRRWLEDAARGVAAFFVLSNTAPKAEFRP